MLAYTFFCKKMVLEMFDLGQTYDNVKTNGVVANIIKMHNKSDVCFHNVFCCWPCWVCKIRHL